MYIQQLGCQGYCRTFTAGLSCSQFSLAYYLNVKEKLANPLTDPNPNPNTKLIL